MGLPPDENLPEVVPDTSPQALTRAEAYWRQRKNEGDAKFAVVYESDTTSPKYYFDPTQNQGAVAVGANGTPISPSPIYTPAPPTGYSDPTLLGETDPESGHGRQRVCGLRRKTFLILLAVLIVVLVAAIGGGVGGAAASRKKKQDTAAEAALSGEDDPASGEATPESRTSTEPRPATTTVTVSADPLSFSTAPQSTATAAPGSAEPGFDMVAWSGDDFKGKSVELTKVGFVDLAFNSTSYKWHPNGSGCCVTFCLGLEKNIGWRCTDFERKQATSNFDRLYFGCGEDASEENSRCDR